MITAGDYIDVLDLGVQPETDSQYFVSPSVQAYLDEHIVNLNPEIKEFIKKIMYIRILNNV
ncbi:hypothetical protein [Exiguobacterium sp. s59]|uniref:hypothetical protein n=1 Tax=Exiguobacterium sp. s59 TaxID=2751269 RepID=UPI001BECD0E1|nr:hypothetical protein [Exiguobacterium sp. s59]